MAGVGNPRLEAEREVSEFLDAVFVPGARLGVRADDPLTFITVVEVEEVTTIGFPAVG